MYGVAQEILCRWPTYSAVRAMRDQAVGDQAVGLDLAASARSPLCLVSLVPYFQHFWQYQQRLDRSHLGIHKS